MIMLCGREEGGEELWWACPKLGTGVRSESWRSSGGGVLIRRSSSVEFVGSVFVEGCGDGSVVAGVAFFRFSSWSRRT